MKEQYGSHYEVFQKKRFWGLLLALFLFLLVPAQAEPPIAEDPDGWYFRAREMAFDGNYEEAREICRQILELFPHYHDVKILKARTYSWEGQFVRSNDLLREVLQADPNNTDALFALIDLQIWYEDYEEAIKFIDVALARDPNNVHLLYRKALALKETGDEVAAVLLLNQILTIDPTFQDAKDLLDTIEVNRMQNWAGLGYRGTYFPFADLPVNNDNNGNNDNNDSENNGFEVTPWHLVYAELGRRTRVLGPAALRANYAIRPDIDATSLQIEADAYPTIRPGTYLYLNFGFSPDRRLFPVTRFGFELFQALPSSMEISGGFRILNFDDRESLVITKDLLIITGSLSKYYRNYYFSFRPYFTFSSDGSDPESQAYFLTARRFLSSTDHFISLTIGRGFSADFSQLIGGEVYDLGATTVDLSLLYQQRIGNRFLFRLGAGYKIYQEEVIFGNPVTAEGALIYRF